MAFLDRIRRRRDDAAHVTCTFQGLDGDEQAVRPDVPAQPGLEESPQVGARSGSVFGTAVGQDRIDLGQYVDQVCSRVLGIRNRCKLTCTRQTLLSVSPQLPLEIVMQMFRRMG